MLENVHLRETNRTALVINHEKESLKISKERHILFFR